MVTHTTIKSWGALALGVFFTAITARTIFDDVWHGAEFTVSHINAVGALVAAIAAGHLVWPMTKQRRVLAAIGLSLIFAASTGYIVTSAGARNAEVSQAKASKIQAVNIQRAAQLEKVATAEKDLETAKTDARLAALAATTECASGKGRKCDGKAATRDHADGIVEKSQSHLDLMRGQLYLLGPETMPFVGYHQTAKVFEAAGLGSAAVIEARLELLLPFALVLISELGTLVFLGMALGQTAVKSRETIAPAPLPMIIASEEPAPERTFEASKSAALATNDNVDDLELATVAALFRGDLDPDGNGGGGGGKVVPIKRWEKAEVRADLERYVKTHGSLPSQTAVCKMYGRAPATVHGWFKQWEAEGQAIKRQQVGRRKQVG